MKPDECIDMVDRFRRETVAAKCRSLDDLVLLASQLAFQSSLIFHALGGARMVAAQFYRIADEQASLVDPTGGPDHEAPPS